MASFRNLFKFLVPSWLSTGDGELVMHSLAIIKDAVLERSLQGLNARFPSRSSASALALTGIDRGIPRGRDETDAHYAQRLIAWRYPQGHRVRGNAFALLNQVSEYFGGVACQTQDVSGNQHTRTAEGIESSASVDWLWYGTPGVNWARFFVAITPSADTVDAREWSDFGTAALWGGALGVEGTTIGQTNISVNDVTAIRNLFEGIAWKPAGVRPEWLIIELDGTVHATTTAWESWSEAATDTQSATRDGGWRYISLSPTLNNVYSARSNYPTYVDMPDGTTYAGSGTSFADNTTLPDGSTYAGSSATFHQTVQLVDDGDLPA